MFNAIYLPALPPQTTDPSKNGFATRKEAQEYIKTHFCSACLAEEFIGESSGCGCEWDIEEVEDET
jgi:hypothetical protein